MFEDEPNVKVTEIGAEELRQLFPNAPRVDLGAVTPKEKLVEREIQGELGEIKTKAVKAFQLEWNGSRVPVGVKVGGYEIKRTQNGVVASRNGDYIGTYDRIVDSEGPDKKQLMIIFLDPKLG